MNCLTDIFNRGVMRRNRFSQRFPLPILLASLLPKGHVPPHAGYPPLEQTLQAAEAGQYRQKEETVAYHRYQNGKRLNFTVRERGMGRAALV